MSHAVCFLMAWARSPKTHSAARMIYKCERPYDTSMSGSQRLTNAKHRYSCTECLSTYRQHAVHVMSASLAAESSVGTQIELPEESWTNAVLEGLTRKAKCVRLEFEMQPEVNGERNNERAHNKTNDEWEQKTVGLKQKRFGWNILVFVEHCNRKLSPHYSVNPLRA